MEQELYAREERLISSVEQLLSSEDAHGNPLFPVLENLLGHYRKLYRQSSRMVKISDRLQQEMSQKNEEINNLLIEITMKNKALEVVSNKLSKYLDPQVYNSIFTGDQEVIIQSRRKKLTVFFSDIVGFTQITESMETEDLTSMLNEYLNEMSRIALRHGGTIDKFIGDAIMIFFGDPESKGLQLDAVRCVSMAVEMRDKLQELRDRWFNQGIERPLHARMGINTGYCTVGNFGSADRMDYTIIGSQVNVASRLESLAPPGQILISHETYAMVRDSFYCKPSGEVQVKGLSVPIQSYTVVNPVDRLALEDQEINLKGEAEDDFLVRINLERLTSEGRENLKQELEKVLLRLRF